jgi:hypothetical protein
MVQKVKERGARLGRDYSLAAIAESSLLQSIIRLK